ncbi:MAG: hypothetical protein ACREBC_25610, partial [Pyrinomonadaceae bacterium]
SSAMKYAAPMRSPLRDNETRSAAPGKRARKGDGVPRRRLQRMVGPRPPKYPTTERRRQAAMGFR